MKFFTLLAFFILSTTQVFAVNCTITPKVKYEGMAIMDSSLVEGEWEQYGRRLGLTESTIDVSDWKQCYELAVRELKNFIAENNLYLNTTKCYSVEVTRRNALGFGFKEKYKMYFSWSVDDSSIPLADTSGKINCHTNLDREADTGDQRWK